MSLKGSEACCDLYLNGPSVISKPRPKRRDLLAYNASNNGYSQTWSSRSDSGGAVIGAILKYGARDHRKFNLYWFLEAVQFAPLRWTTSRPPASASGSAATR